MHAFRLATGIVVSHLAAAPAAGGTVPASMISTATLSYGGKGAEVCVHDNGPPLDAFGAPASQEDPVYPFFAEAADDFIFEGEGQCRVSEIVFWVNFFNVPSGALPDPSVWTAVRLTVYPDDGGEPSHPDGKPQFPYTGFHVGNVFYEATVSITDVTTKPLVLDVVPNVWRINIQHEFTVQRGVKYWLALAPKVQFQQAGQTSWMLSEASFENPASQAFELIGILPWQTIGGDGEGHQDLAFQIIGEAIDFGDCPWDMDLDGTVGSADLAQVLGRWGEDPGGPPDFNGDGTVDAADLADLLGNWGPCEVP